MAGGLGDGGDAAHEGAADTENVDMHDGKAREIRESGKDTGFQAKKAATTGSPDAGSQGLIA
ncbi:hypothetical protein GCM10011419_17290 [Vogesella fluminis]|uniref:Uncharacterized protein n=1 Tax=Vogesella fluminis TaxID=1069161 RepID=A0ABQ3HA32_9NEIS|nr:hypothetical protein GCM10011419_17290 [Vogesella fluminis]